MGQTSISWTATVLPDGTTLPGYTFNPWIGCTKVSAGCLNCYAERQNNFHKWNLNGWGDNAPRVRTSKNNWKQPIKWAKQAVKDGVTRRVFCASLADVFDKNIDDSWWVQLFDLIYDTQKIGGLEWLILTKRPENIHSFYDEMFEELTNIRIGITCENQEMADLRIPELLRNWHGKNFISYEPALSKVDFVSSIFRPGIWELTGGDEYTKIGLRGIDWVICGCESGNNARPMNLDWARLVRDQCVFADIPFLMKQMVIDGKLVREPYLDGKQWIEFPEVI